MTQCPVPWVFDTYAESAVEPVVVNGDHELPEALCSVCNLLHNAHLSACPTCLER